MAGRSLRLKWNPPMARASRLKAERRFDRAHIHARMIAVLNKNVPAAMDA